SPSARWPPWVLEARVSVGALGLCAACAITRRGADDDDAGYERSGALGRGVPRMRTARLRCGGPDCVRHVRAPALPTRGHPLRVGEVAPCVRARPAAVA